MSIGFEVTITVKAFVVAPEGDEGIGFGEYQASGMAMEYGLSNLVGGGEYEFVGLTVNRLVLPDDEDGEDYEDGETEDDDQERYEDTQERYEDTQERSEDQEDGSQDQEDDERSEDDTEDQERYEDEDEDEDNHGQEDDGDDGDDGDIDIESLRETIKELPKSNETLKIARRTN